MFIRPRVLSILTTRRCTAACDHCCVGASPRAKDAIPIERIHGLIDEAKRIPTIERIVFTGGECFLLGRHLDSLTAHAHNLGFRTRAISNGYWATTGSAAGERMRTLHGAGLDELMLSTGTFHQRFVPVERIVTAARAAVTLGIVTRISVESCEQSTFSAEALGNILGPEVASGLLHIATSPWIEDVEGRGKETITHHHDVIPLETMERLRCAHVLNTLAVTPDQVLTACCGFPMESLNDLRIGSVIDQPLDEIVRTAPVNLFAMWMHARGPASIASFISQYADNFTMPPVASICEACTALQRSRIAMSVFAKHGHEAVQDVTEEFVMKQHYDVTVTAR